MSKKISLAKLMKTSMVLVLLASLGVLMIKHGSRRGLKRENNIFGVVKSRGSPPARSGSSDQTYIPGSGR